MHNVQNDNDSGTGSLRDIIENVSAPDDTIYFDIAGTIDLTSGEITITHSLTIIGPAWDQIAIEGSNLSRIFRIMGAGTDVYIYGVNMFNTVNSAIYCSPGTSLVLIYCEFISNTGATGGVVFNDDGQVDISHCSFSNNSATTSGGVLYGSTNATFDVVNSTFYLNDAPNGGVLYVNANAYANLVNITMTGNTSTSGGGAITIAGAATVELENSIVALNGGPTLSPNVSGTLNSNGHNCINDPLGILGALWPLGSDIAVDPLFDTGTLEDLGRRTGVVALSGSSPCIDAGNSSVMTDPEDNRGIVRHLDGDMDGTIDVDIGACEYSPFCVTNTSGSVSTPGSLPFVLAQAHSGSGGAPPFYVCFSINGVTTQTITVNAPLAAFTQGATYVDGFTQEGSYPNVGVVDATLNIDVDGTSLSSAGSGFHVQAGGAGSVLQGLIVGSFPEYGIRLDGVADVSVLGCHIGVDDSGSGPLPNALAGILLENIANQCKIGGDEDWKRNIISGNGGDGITINTTSFGNTVERNYIGMDQTGTVDIANSAFGIVISDGASANQIGRAGSGNVISGNGGGGIIISNTANTNVVQGNVVGLNVNSNAAVQNGSYGIRLESGVYDNVIGGTHSEGNVISGNTDGGIHMIGAGTGNQIMGNYIGTDALGTTVYANSGNGIFVNNCVPGNEIGAPNMGNLISGHSVIGDYGINIASDGVIVRSNYIGCDITGTISLPNHDGIYIVGSGNQIGGPNANEGNLVSGNTAYGINLWGGGSNLIQGNNCGLNANFNGTLSNNIGIYVNSNGNTIGGIGANDANICSGNNFEGIRIDGADNNILHGNIVGLDNSGTTAYGNQSSGILVTNGAVGNVIGGDRSIDEGNLISGNGSYGIYITNSTTDSTEVYGNVVGLNVLGTAAVPNGNAGIYINVSGNTQIGNGSSDFRNIISGNNGYGILIDNAGGGNTIQGNYVGTDIDALTARPNTSVGVEVRAASQPVLIDGTAFPNVISGNSSFGIVLDNDSSIVIGNLIGTNAANTSLPNNAGIDIGGSYNRIGGNTTGEGNTIAHNTTDGIQITTGTANHNSFLQNAIFSNGDASIDFNNDGVTSNDIGGDTDTGPNELQNYPVYADVTLCGGELYTAFGLNSKPNTTYHIEFFITPPALIDGSGHGEIQQYVGSTTVTTDVNGSVIQQEVISGSFNLGDFLTMTATELNGGEFGSTSELSQSRTIVGEITAVQFGSDNPTCAGSSSGMIYPQVVTGGDGPYTYAWSDGQTTDTAFSLPAGSYNAIVSDNNGCPFTGTNITLIDPPSLSISLNINPEICDGACDGYVVASASGGTGPYTYEEVGGSVSPNDSIQNLCAGNVTIRVTDNVGCTLDTTISINPGIVENSNLGYTQNTWCADDAAFSPSTIGTTGGTFTAMPAGLGINAGTGAIDPSASAVNGYTVTYTTPTCNLVSNYTIVINATEDASFSYGTDTFCVAAGNALPTVTGTNGGGFTAQAGVAIAVDGTIDLTNSTPGGPYQVYYTTPGTCAAIDSFEIVIIGVPDATILNPITTACKADASTNLTAATPGGTWSGAGITDAVNGTFDPASAVIGLNEIVYQVDAGFGCFDGDTIYIEVFDHPTATLSGGGNYCAGDQPPSIDVTFGNQTTNSTFDIYIDGNFDQTVNVSGNPTTINPGNGAITIQNIVSINGCASLNPTNTVDVIEVQPPPAPITNYTDTSYCSGQTVLDLTAITANGGTVIWYSDAALTVQVGTGSPFTPVLSAGTNELYVVEDDNGCVGPATQVNIELVDLATPLADPVYEYCEGDSIAPITATANAGGTLTWYSDAALTNVLGTGATLIIPQGLLGDFVYFVTETVGDCESSAVQVDVLVYGGNGSGAGIDLTICAGDSVQLGGFGGVSYLWTPALNLSDSSAATPFASPDTTTTYVLAAFDGLCTYYDSATVTVQSAEVCGLHIFNAFSPDGDGVNDTWLIEGLVGYLDNQVLIMNRWGDELRSFSGYNNNDVVWDGTNNGGEELPTGTYYYIIKLNDINETYSGWVYLER